MFNGCYKCGSEMKEVNTFVIIQKSKIKSCAYKCMKCGEEEFSGKEVDRIQNMIKSLKRK